MRSISGMTDNGAEHPHEPAGADVPIDHDRLRCSFCGKAYADVQTMVCGPTPAVAICNECVALVTEIMDEEVSGPSDAA